MKSRMLFVARVMWAALILGVMLFLGVAVAVKGNTKADPQVARLLLVMGALLFAFALALSFILRALITRAGDDGMIDPRKYFTGTIVFLAGCEGPALFGIIQIVLSGNVWPGVIVPALALGAMLVSFPTGMGVRED